MTEEQPFETPPTTPTTTPQVTAVIPTLGRPSVRDAVRSALRQTLATTPLVVVDDPDAVSTVRHRLAGLPHRLITTAGRRGGSAARNLGVEAAETPWVGFLDDDDAWVEDKARRQVEALTLSGLDDAPESAVSCRALLLGAHSRVVPEQTYRSPSAGGVGVADYVLRRTSLRLRRHFLQTSTLLCSRQAARAVPWDETLPRHQDWDWLIRWEQAGMRLHMLDEVLVRVRQHSPGSISSSTAWRASRRWMDSLPQEISSSARADFRASVVARSAFASGAWGRGLGETLGGLRGGAHPAALLTALSGLAPRTGRDARP